MVEEELKVIAELEDEGFSSGVDGLIKKLTRATDIGGEFEIGLNLISTALKAATGVALGFGAAILAALTGGVIASPQFKQMIAGLREPWHRFTMFMGQSFQGAITATGEALRDLINWWVTDPNVKTVMDLVGKAFETTVRVLADVFLGDEENEGYLKQLFSWLGTGVDVVRKTVEIVVKTISEITGEPEAEIEAGLKEGFVEGAKQGVRTALPGYTTQQLIRLYAEEPEDRVQEGIRGVVLPGYWTIRALQKGRQYMIVKLDEGSIQ